jgi:chromosome segregation ATPase
MDVHRQCLALFVSRCHAYADVLQRVRSEYDTVLANWRAQAAFLGPLHGRLAAMPSEAAERLADARARHTAVEAALEDELDKDRVRIRELVLEQEVLIEEHERLTAQVDAAESTLTDRQKSNSLLLIGLKNAEESEERQLALDAEHRRTSEANRRRYLAVISDLEQNLEEYEALKAEVAGMTPRADLEATNRQVNSRQRQLYLAKNNYQQLLEAHQQLLTEYRAHADEYATLTAEIQRLRCRTPRPQWGSVRDYLPPNATVKPHEDSSVDIARALYDEVL